ncbi:MAG: hypothetical protein A2007_05060 [Verrucomicrobia bacterium GWC2_42_7]|nr:MAG: hypothetical protein A2007_05060 [Verrucomicrobia bacterium GWC2_42_7]
MGVILKIVAWINQVVTHCLFTDETKLLCFPLAISVFSGDMQMQKPFFFEKERLLHFYVLYPSLA